MLNDMLQTKTFIAQILKNKYHGYGISYHSNYLQKNDLTDNSLKLKGAK